MPKDSDKKRTLDDDNETLVKALESIKTLLATSEDKLNKARESIDQASSYTMRGEQDIPILDEVVVPGNVLDQTEMLNLNQELASNASQADLLIQQMEEKQDISPGAEPQPESVSAPRPEMTAETKPASSSPRQTAPTQLDLTQLKQELEAEMHEKLAAYAASLEEDLKAKIQIYLERQNLQEK